MELVFDIEASNLLNNDTIDYNASPYKLKPDYKFHCLVCKDIKTGIVYKFDPEHFAEGVEFIKANATKLIGHNIIDYDLLALKLGFDFDYTINPPTICGKPCEIVDTLVLSKVLNPDRPEHSIDYFGRVLGLEKIDWRSKAVELGLIEHNSPRGYEFLVYHPEMLEYNERDVNVNEKVYNYLMAEWGDWDWTNAFQLELAVRDIVTRGSHRGFKFDKDLAEANVRELDTMMLEIEQKVEPVLPPKRMAKTASAYYCPPKSQFKKDGSFSSHMLKFAEKLGAELNEDERLFTFQGKVYDLPLVQEPLETTEPAQLKDTTHIKEWLISLGWEPTAYKERDLTVDVKKKKLTKEKFLETVERYYNQTVETNFKNDRFEHLRNLLKCRDSQILEKMREYDISRPLKVLTNPTLTVGMEKEICPNLLLLTDKFPYAKDVVNYLTYRHRRNSILGGGVGLDEDDEEPTKGFLALMRDDGRIATPADSCGAATSRFKHKQVANVPRITSLYGEKMRALFGVDSTHYQVGYDFNSLEAMIESHYCHRYDADKEYCKSLILEKPNDCHTKLAEYISDLLGRKFPRGSAKNVKYGCSYGAQPPRVAKTVGESLSVGKTVYNAFWEKAAPLKGLKDMLEKYWETTGKKKFLLGIDGRKLPVRSKSNLINTLFQSAGVICAKKAMVIYDQKLKERGLNVDFFRDDWKSKQYVQQMIAYHDECQIEVSKSLVKFKLFKTEDEAKTFKDKNIGWSDIGHTEKGYYLAYTIAGVLAQESVAEASKHFKLNVDLTAGYMVGTQWQQCH